MRESKGKKCVLLRNRFIKVIRADRWLVIALAAVMCLACLLAGEAEAASVAEQQAAAITKQIAEPAIPQNRRKLVTDFGAVSGTQDSLPAFQRAVDHLSAEGGGVVVVPAGHFYLAGPLTMKSHVELHLADGAVIEFSHNPKDYEKHIVLTRFECTECYNYSPLIYAYDAEDIAITGSGKERQGIIDGNGSAWWPWVGAGYWKNCYPSQQEDSDNLKDMGNADVPVASRVFGKGHYLRPVLIQPYASKRFLIRGVLVKDSPMYHINPVLCRDVIVDNVTIQATGPNTDGVDPDACENVWIRNSIFSTGDDCIAIKSGRDGEGRRVGKPSQNIVIENNLFRSGHGGVTMGSEMAGGIYRVYSIRNTMDSPNLHWAYRLKTNSLRGGGVADFYAYGDTIQRVDRAVLTIDMAYGGGDIGDFTPDIHSIHMEGLQVEAHHAPLATISTYERNPVYDFTWKDCVVAHAGSSGGHVFQLENTPAENLTLKDMQINGKMRNGHADF